MHSIPIPPPIPPGFITSPRLVCVLVPLLYDMFLGRFSSSTYAYTRAINQVLYFLRG